MINVEIITPEGVYKSLETPIINITSVDGERGILPNHMPIVFMLDIGHLITEEENIRKEYAISGGMLYFDSNQAKILVNEIESKDDIDKERAIASKERQLAKLASKDSNIDMKRAEIALKKALNRIKIASH